MSDESLWMSGGALLVSVISAAFAGWSGWEAKNARRIAKSDFLNEYFSAASYLFVVTAHRQTTDYDDEKLQKANRAVEKLKDILSNDAEFVSLLDELYKSANTLSFETHKNLARIKTETSVTPNPDLEQMKALWNQKKHEHLCIG